MKIKEQKSVASGEARLHSGTQVPIAGVDYELKLPKGHLSYSQIDRYMKCPQQYYRDHYTETVKQQSSEAFEGVALAHTLEAVGESRYLRKKLPTIKSLTTRHQKFWEAHRAEVTDWNRDEGELINRAAQMLQLFLRQEATDLQPVDVDKQPGIEIEFNTIIAGVPVVGKADLVEQNYVWDYKVTGNPRFLNVEKALQLDLYAHVFKRKKVGYIVFDWSKKDLQITQMKADRNLEAAKKWLEIVVSGVAMGISRGVFPVCSPAANFLCNPKWCSHWDTCRGQCEHE